MHTPLKQPSLERVTFSVPSNLMVGLDRDLTNPGESRSAAVRRLIEEAIVRAEEQRERVAYIRAYREQPQTNEEFGYSDLVSVASLAEVPWVE